MIKKLTLSTCAVACLFSNMYAETNLEEAFKNGKFKGEVKSYFFQEDYNTTGRSSIIHYGGSLSYETAKFYGLTTGATMQVSSVGDINKTNKFVNDEDASGAVLSEAFITYNNSNTTVKVGRQYIGTPLLAGSGSRMIRQSFQGYTLVNTDIPNTKVIFAYVDRFQTRTDGAGSPGKFTNKFNTNANLGTITLEDGAYSAYVKNNSIKDLTVQAQFLNAIDVFTSNYLDADYKIGTKANLYVMGQYIGTNYEANSNEDGTFFAARLGGNYNNFNFSASVSENSSDGSVESGLGYGADYSLTGSQIDGGYWSYLADTSAYQVALGTKISDVKLDVIHSSYGLKNNSDIAETNYMVSFDLMKNLNLNILHASFDGKTDKNYESRVKLTYKF